MNKRLIASNFKSFFGRSMARIQQLPPQLINQIAASEVVERPSSVVKEWLENAIDAGSSRIDVEVAHGGCDLIQIVDNGGGIAAEDLPLAFASHATSKLHDLEDLFRIDTLVFRGEALASLGTLGFRGETPLFAPQSLPFSEEARPSLAGGQAISTRG
jgi:hypothetical protein